MIIKNRKLAIMIFLASAVSMTPVISQAAEIITFSENKYVSVNFGMHSSFSTVENAENDGGKSDDFAIGTSHIYLGGSLNKYSKGMFTAEMSSDASMNVIDATNIFQPAPILTICTGHFVSTRSRANTAGHHYTSGDIYLQNIAARYSWNSGTIGRDNGAAVVGTVMGARLAYSFGDVEADKIFFYSAVSDVTTSPNQPENSLNDHHFKFFKERSNRHYFTRRHSASPITFSITIL